MRVYLSSSVIPDTPTYVEKVGEITVGPYVVDVVIKGYGKFHGIYFKIGNAEKFVTSYLTKYHAMQKAKTIVKRPEKWIRWKGAEKNE